MGAAKRGGIPESSLDNLETLRTEVADRQIVLSGVFDQRLKEIAAARAEAMPYLKIADTIDRANAILAEAEAKGTAQNAELDVRAKALADKAGELVLLAASLSEREAAVVKREAEADEAADTARRAEQGRSDAWDKAEAQREAEEKRDRASLAADRAALDQAKAEFEKASSEAADRIAETEAALAERMDNLVRAQEGHAKRVAAFEEEMKQKRIEVDGLKRDLSARLDGAKVTE